MKILAVSDIEDLSLERLIEAGESGSKKLEDMDCVVSCGDLSKKYLEFVTDALNKDFFFVSGNHFIEQFYGDVFKSKKFVKKLYKGKWLKYSFGGSDLHAKIEVFGDYIFAGFGGAMRYNPGPFQFTEREMLRLVRKVIFKIRVKRFFDVLFFRKRKEIIVISHAPVEGVNDCDDVCHKGFSCFKEFIHKMKPLLWLHGHVHPEGQRKKPTQAYLENTLILNVIPSKIIEIGKKSRIFVRQIFNNR